MGRSPLFMASITMLYTRPVSPDIRARTTKAVVKSNINSCFALFWPLATRGHNIIERIGNYTVTLFNAPETSTGDFSDSEAPGGSSQQHFGQIDAEVMEWFGTRNNFVPLSWIRAIGNTMIAIAKEDMEREICRAFQR